MRNVFVWLTVISALIGCRDSSLPNAAPGTPHALQKITVAYTFQPQSTLVHVAQAKGFFAGEGLEVQPLMHTYGKAALQSVIEGKADFATVAETPVMFSVFKGEKIFVIANIESSTMNNGIVARTDAGITAPADLKGKRIAFTPGTTSDFFLDSLLTANGLARQDIQPVPLKPEEMQEAIASGKIDAASTWNYPLAQIGQQLGARGTTFFDRQIYTETFNIATPQEFVRNNPETVKRFLRALIRAENFVAKNPDEAQTIMSSATKTDRQLVRDVWNAFTYRVMLDQTLLITLEDEARWAIKNGLAEQKRMPDFQRHIHAESLKAVRLEAAGASR